MTFWPPDVKKLWYAQYPVYAQPFAGLLLAKQDPSPLDV
jgi:hypothetical protein